MSFIRSAPPAEGLTELAAHVDPGSRPVRVRRIGGGLGAATHAVDLVTRSGARRTVVIKRYEGDEPEVRREWEGLRFAHSSGLPVPEPLAFDASDWFGSPTIVMALAPGAPDVSPVRLDPWLRDIAGTLVRIQATPTGRAPKQIRAPRLSDPWTPHRRLPRTPLMDRAVGFVHDGLTRARSRPRVFGHGDFHPGNLLWKRACLSSAIDWGGAGVFAPEYDVAYVRTDLTVLLGHRAADRFLDHYRAAGGHELPDLATWDVRQALDALCMGRFWVGAYREQGNTAVTPRHVAARIYPFIRRALGRGEG